MKADEGAGRGGMWGMWICLALFVLIALSHFWR